MEQTQLKIAFLNITVGGYPDVKNRNIQLNLTEGPM